MTPRLIPPRDYPRPFATYANAVQYRHPQRRKWWQWWRV